jgi:cobalt/nickel transport system ATP-binding protein
VRGAVRLAGLGYAYPGAAPVLRGADLDVPGGGRLALLGANGSGKSTLLRCLSGAIRPDAGRVLIGGQPVDYSRSGMRRHRQLVQLVTQDPDEQLFSASVAADVSFGPMNLGLPETEIRARVAQSLDLLAVTDLRNRPTHLLSYGERKRVAIAGALAMQPRILALDEPTAGLDPAAVTGTMDALDRLHANGTTLLLATHDVDLALAWADQVAVVVDGRVRQGDPATLLADPALVADARLHTPWVLSVLGRLTSRGVLPDGARARDQAALLTLLDAATQPVHGGPTRTQASGHRDHRHLDHRHPCR